MTSPGENFQFPSAEVSWLKRDLLLFAVSIEASTDDLNTVFTSTGSIAYYMFPSSNEIY